MSETARFPNPGPMAPLQPQDSLRRKVLAGFGIGLAILVIVGGLSWRAARESLHAAAERRASDALRTAFHQVLSDMQDAETGQRGYLLSGDDTYLAPYLAGTTTVVRSLEQLRHLTTAQHDPRALQGIDSLARVTLGELAATIAARRDHGLGAALEILRAGQGKAAMDSLRARVSAIEPAERMRTDYWDERARVAGQQAIVATLVGTLLAVLFLLGAGVVVDRDISARERAEQEAWRSRSFLASVLEHLPNMVFVKSADDLRFVSFNDAGEKLLGLRREALIGKTDFDLFPRGEAEFFVGKDRDVLAAGTVVDIAEEPIHTSRGVRFLHTRKVPIPDETGRAVFLLGVSEDITERKHAEELQRASAAEIQDLYDNAPCGYHSLDAEGVFVRINSTEATWLGYAREEIVGRLTFRDVLTPESQRRFEETFPLFKSRGWIQNVEFDLIRRDGSILPVSLSATAVFGSDGGFVMSRSTMFDITDRRRAAEALQQANEQLELRVQERTEELAATNEELRHTVEEVQVAEEELRQQNDELAGAHDAVLASEERLRAASGLLPLILFNQDAGLRYTWASGPPGGKDLVGRTDVDLLDPADARAVVALKRRVLESGEGIRRELAVGAGDQRVIYDVIVEPRRDATGRIIGLSGAALDITARKRADEESRLAHEELHALVEASPQAIVGIDRDGIVTSWHGGAERMFGWSAAEVLGRPLPVVPPERETEYRGLVRDVLAGRAFTDFHTARRRRDGSLVEVSVSTAPLHDAEGRAIGLVAVYTDISERLRALDHQRAREAAEAANRAKSQFLANMSHELRTPLNAIIGFSELLEDQTFGELNERQRKYVNNILTSGRHLLDLVNDILDLAKVEAGRLGLDGSRFDPAVALGEAKRIVENLAIAKGIRLDLEVPADLPEITADRAKFKQILYNLLSNAVKFTPEGGRVRMQARALAENGGPPDHLQLAVADNGIGIAPEDQERIFLEFEQIDSSYARQQQGTGLGLALTRRLVELHGGRIWVESASGQGSTFFVVLPLVPPALVRPRDSGPATIRETPADDRPLVLVVEDDPVAAELLAHYLSERGYAVVHATNGAQALDLAQRLQPVAITLDVLLPDEDGLEILARLRALAETREIPVVVVSITDDRELGLTLGAAEWLVKPVNRERFVQAVIDASPGAATPRTTTVLVVDDHRETVDLLAETLGRRGFRVLRAYDGEDGLRIARQRRPDMIVLDLVMPGLTGFEVVERLQQDEGTRSIPVLVFTFKELTEEECRVLRPHVQTVVSKSDASNLLEALQQLAAGRRRSGPEAGSRRGTE